jgi:sarcosine oxidase subunit gamma
MSEPRLHSALARQPAPQNLAVSIAEVVDRGMVDVRGDPGDPAFAGAVSQVLGTELPRQPRSSVAAGDLSVLWLSVDQWMVQCPRAEASALARTLVEALAGVHSLVVDMSDARTVLRLQGESVRELVMKGAPVDLTSAAFTGRTVRRLRFGEIAAMVHLVGEDPDVIDLFVFRSYAVFAWKWLVATGHPAAKIRLFEPQPPPTA